MTEPVFDIVVIRKAGDWAHALPGAEMLAERCARAVLADWDGLADGQAGEVSVLLTDDAQQQALNRAWRGQDKPTNVLSFPGDDPADVPAGVPVLLGDISLALETLMREAGTGEKSLSDHFCHLVVHGMLHLLGFDHVSAEQADEMEPREIEILSGLGVASPYPDRSK